MIIDCISDLHGELPKLDGGDLLIIAGDITARDKVPEWADFFTWLAKQDYKKKILIAGNHDGFLSQCASSKEGKILDSMVGKEFDYLLDTGCEYEGYKIWGSPWSLWFHGINPQCKYFTCTESHIAKKWALIPSDTDILITHSPPNGILDRIKAYDTGGYLFTGSVNLRDTVRAIKPKLHVFGHIHEHGGCIIDADDTKFINASIMNEVYDPVNKPIRVIL